MEEQVDPEVAQQNLEELQETLRKFRNLVQQPGWDELLKIGKVQADSRRHKWTHTPLVSTAELGVQQFELGEASGMFTLMALPKTIIDTHEEMVRLEVSKLPDEGDEE